jgi:hypothetical protein
MTSIAKKVSTHSEVVVESAIVLGLAIAALVCLNLAGCTGTVTPSPMPAGPFKSMLNGGPCQPDGETYMPVDAAPAQNDGGQGQGKANGGARSPTGIPGDNMDDLHSGKIDCYYDGNSGQGDDKKHPCTAEDFPQPGCDAEGCCDAAEDPAAPSDDSEPPAGDTPPPADDSQPPPDCSALNDRCGVGVADENGQCVYQPLPTCAVAQ